jgi:TonB family protein
MGRDGVLRKVVMGLALGAAVSGAASAKDREPDILAREGKWVVDYDRDACHLAAQFGKGEDAVVMRLTRYEPGDSFDFSLYGKRFRSNEPRVGAKLDFGIGSGPVAAEATTGTAGKLQALFFSSLRLDGWEHQSDADVRPQISPAQEASVKGVTVVVRGRRPLRLDFGSLARPMEQMRNCTANLVKSWGYDPAAQAALTRPAKPAGSPGDWLSSSDYPAGSLMMGHNGLVQFRLDVDAAGKVAGCFVLARTNPDDFADVTCRAVARRAKLEPALDAQGKPIRSYYVQKVHWRTGS